MYFVMGLVPVFRLTDTAPRYEKALRVNRERRTRLTNILTLCAFVIIVISIVAAAVSAEPNIARASSVVALSVILIVALLTLLPTYARRQAELLAGYLRQIYVSALDYSYDLAVGEHGKLRHDLDKVREFLTHPRVIEMDRELHQEIDLDPDELQYRLFCKREIILIAHEIFGETMGDWEETALLEHNDLLGEARHVHREEHRRIADSYDAQIKALETEHQYVLREVNEQYGQRIAKIRAQRDRIMEPIVKRGSRLARMM